MLLTAATMSFRFRWTTTESLNGYCRAPRFPEVRLLLISRHRASHPTSVTVDGTEAQIVASSRRRLLALVPHDIHSQRLKSWSTAIGGFQKPFLLRAWLWARSSLEIFILSRTPRSILVTDLCT
jgi:hypothetical protein